MKARGLLVAMVTAASILAVGAPAGAASTTTIRSWENSLDVEVVDCALTVAPGTTCRWFRLLATDEQEPNGTTTLDFAGKGGTATKQNDGTFLADQATTAIATTTGTLRSTNLGKLGKLTMTIGLVCTVPGCGLDGTFTFTLTTKPTAHGRHAYQSVVQTARQDNCRYRITGYQAELARFTGSGKVSVNGTTKTLRVLTTAGPHNSFHTSNIVFRYPAACPLPT